MPSVEVLVAILGAAMTIITVLGGVVWSMLRAEAKEHTEQIKGKADNERLHEIEARWQSELVAVKTDSERLITKLEDRHNREIDQLATRLGDQIRNSETSILAQIRLMVEALKK